MPEASIPWSRLFANVRARPGEAQLDVPDDWTIGRTVFGGVQAALALRAMRTLVPDVPLRTLQGTFFAPVPEGLVTARATIARTGKNATHVEARLLEGEVTLALLVGVFGAARESVVAVEPQPFARDEGKPIGFPYVAGLTPEFTQHFRARWLQGTPPFTGDTHAVQLLEVGMRDEGPVTEGHVVAIADFIAPIALSHLKTFARAGTLTWMLEFLTERFERFAIDGWQVEGRLDHAREGYTGQSITVRAPGGQAVAMSRQSMVVFG